jgi:hypothetical protein
VPVICCARREPLGVVLKRRISDNALEVFFTAFPECHEINWRIRYVKKCCTPYNWTKGT